MKASIILRPALACLALAPTIHASVVNDGACDAATIRDAIQAA